MKSRRAIVDTALLLLLGAAMAADLLLIFAFAPVERTIDRR